VQLPRGHFVSAASLHTKGVFMKTALIALLAALGIIGTANTATAAGSAATSTVTGTGAQFNGQAQAVLPGQTVTLNVSSGSTPTIVQTTNTAPAGTASTSASASLSVGAVVGGGFGNTSGVTSTLNGAVPISTLTPLTTSGALNNAAHANGIVGF
jgi:hypothetical protein